jgi:hypothetical protein
MAKYMSNHSSNYNQMSRFLAQKSTVTASCYTVESASAKVHGFHYCTTLGAGESKTSSSSLLSLPPHVLLPLASARN